MNVAADTPPPGSSLPTTETTQAPESKTPPHESNRDSSLPTPKRKQAPELKTPPHESNPVPGLVFNLLLPPNPESVLPLVCRPKSCQFAVLFFLLFSIQ